MAGSASIRDDVEYQKLRLKLIKRVEGKVNQVYTDGKGLATIGYGFNIKDNSALRSSVYGKLGIGSSPSDLIWRGKLDGAITNFSTPKDFTVLKGKLDDILKLREKEIKTTTPNAAVITSFSISDIQIDEIFIDGVKPFEDHVDGWLNGVEVDAGQRLALLSLSWGGKPMTYKVKPAPANSPQGTPPTYIYESSSLYNALKTGNRAEAWYQIRYQSNKDLVQNKRRYMESQIFGLYANPTNVDDGEAQQVIDTYLSHLAQIKIYEQKHQHRIKDANDEFAAVDIRVAGTTKNLTVDSIGQIFKPIANYIYKTYALTADLRAHDLNDGRINFNTAMTGDVVVGYETQGGSDDVAFIQPIYRWLVGASPSSEVGLPAGITGINDLLVALDDKAYNLQGLYGDDILIGGVNDDTLYGGYKADRIGSGNDVLIGGGGNDNLYGQDGNNVLRGGNGDDNYYMDIGATNKRSTALHHFAFPFFELSNPSAFQSL